MEKDKLFHEEKESISVLGTGNMGRAFTKLLLPHYRVIVGSRAPENRTLGGWDESLAKIDVLPISDAIQQSPIIFFCLHIDHVKSLMPFKEALTGKIIVDVSNPLKRGGSDSKTTESSNAEVIRSMFPESTIVKAFNTWSSQALEDVPYTTPTNKVHVATSDDSARDSIGKVVENTGLVPVYHNSLKDARELEQRMTGAVKQWKGPIIVTLVIFTVWFVYATIRSHYIKGQGFDRFLLHTMNKILGATGLTSLACVYLPGSFAAILQLYYGTNAKPFPGFLDAWLRMRKELGLLAFWFSGLHGLTSMTLSPGYLTSMYPKPGPIAIATMNFNGTILVSAPAPPMMLWHGEGTFFLGCLAIGLFVIPALTSLPSISQTLNGDQWWLCQSFVGHVALSVATVHVFFKSFYNWGTKPFASTIQKISFLTLILPTLTLLIRIILMTPCIWRKLRWIRRGGMRKEAEVV